MSSDLSTYDPNKRCNDVLKKLRQSVDVSEVMREVLNDYPESKGNKSGDNFAIKSTQLRDLNERIQMLDMDVDQLNTDGYGKQFLQMNAEVVQVLSELDAMGSDLSPELRSDRKESIISANKVSEKLTQKAFADLIHKFQELLKNDEIFEMTEVKLGFTDQQIKTEIELISKLKLKLTRNEISIEQKSETKNAIKDLESYYLEVKKRVNSIECLSRIKRRRIDTELDMTLELIQTESNDWKAIEEQKERLKNTIDMLLKQ